MPDKRITQLLLGTEAVTDIVGQRIRPGKLDDADSRPGIIVERNMKLPVNHATGTTATKFGHVLIGCVAATYAAAIALADVVEATVNGFSDPGGATDVRMCHVRAVSYEPDPPVAGKDQLRERFVLECHVQYTE